MKIVYWLAMLLLAGSPAYGQGSLTPPGAPAAGMKTLGQIEPRIPISQPNYTCNVAGASYYLTTNLVATGSDPVIQVATNSITLDLGGFAILGAAGTGNGISIYKGSDDVVVRNGTIRDCYHHGIYANLAERGTFEDLRIIGNGRASATYDGLDAGGEARVIDCRIEYNGGTGLVLGEGGLVRDCLVSTNTDGVVVSGNSQIIHNSITHNSDNGLKLNGTGSYVADNIVRDNADNYDLVKGNHLNLLLCEIPETLDWPCSATLAGTLTMAASTNHGITVTTNNITVDLAGHALVGPGAAGAGIYQRSGLRNLTVRNGTLSGWNGADGGGVITDGTGSLLENLLVSGNERGIAAHKDTVIRNCVAQENSSYGIWAEEGAVISDCTVSSNGNVGLSVLGGVIQRCTARYNGNDGIEMSYHGTLSDCFASYNIDNGFNITRGTLMNCKSYANGNAGFNLHTESMASHCQAQGNDEHGFALSGSCLLDSCSATDNGGAVTDGAGVYVFSTYNELRNNVASGNDLGFSVNNAHNFLTGNKAGANTTNWLVAAGNVCLVINASTNNTTISGNAGGTAPGSTDPNANFTF